MKANGKAAGEAQDCAAEKPARRACAQRAVRNARFFVALACAVVVSATTFMDAVTIPPIGGQFGATLFEITPYVQGLNDMYGRWLPDMLQDPAGSTMQFILNVGCPALVAVEALSIASIGLFVVFAVATGAGRIRLAKACGIAAFVFGLLLPVALVAAQAIVNGRFANDMLTDIVLLKTLPAMYARLTCGVMGLVAVVLSAKAGIQKENGGDAHEC